MPVYNEQHTVREIIEKVLSLDLEKEIIVIDDGSTDSTPEILKKSFQKHKDIQIIFQKQNMGKGAAIISGLKKATGDYIVIQDADLELDPLDIVELVSTAKRGHEVVYGSRFLKKRKMPVINFMANKFLTFLTNVFYGGKITDMETCYKMCKRDILLSLKLKSKGFEIEPEITCKILKKKYKIKEIPVSYTPRRAGKKICWIDGFRAIFTILKYRIT